MNKVQGREGLYKDPANGGVVNTDNNAYELAKQHKRKIIKERQKNVELEQRIERLESLIEKLGSDQ